MTISLYFGRIVPRAKPVTVTNASTLALALLHPDRLFAELALGATHVITEPFALVPSVRTVILSSSAALLSGVKSDNPCREPSSFLSRTPFPLSLSSGILEKLNTTKQLGNENQDKATHSANAYRMESSHRCIKKKETLYLSNK